MRNKLLNITKSAGNQLIKIAKNNNVNNILFSVSSGGCNGFNYQFSPLEKTGGNKLDEIVPYENINIVICGHSLFAVLGTTIDWKKDIMGESFNFTNPNASSQCGCGSSFSPK